MLIRQKNYTAELCEATGEILTLIAADDKAKHNAVDATGHFGGLCFTLKDEETEVIDRYAGKGQAYILKDRYASFEKTEKSSFLFENRAHKSTLKYDFSDDAFTVTLDCGDGDLSQYGLSLDTDMMDKDQKGDFNTQFLPVFPYSSEDGSLKFYAMTRPDGLWILFIALSECAGWRVVYDSEREHILNGFQFLSQFDSRISGKTGKTPLKVRVSFHKSYDEILKTVKKVTGTALPESFSYGVLIGERVYGTAGDNKAVFLKKPDGTVETLEIKKKSFSFIPQNPGFYVLTAGEEIKSNAVYFAYENDKDLFVRATDAIKEPYHCDFNLCEGAMWLWALLIRKKLFGSAGKNEYRIQKFFNDNTCVTKENVTDDDIGKIVSFPHDFGGQHCSEYHLYKLNRIQNAVVQAEIMLEAWRCYHDEKYLTLSKEYLKNIIRDHMNEKGALVCNIFGESSADYSTVTACIFGFVDLYRELTLLGEEAEEFGKASLRVADHLVKRGLNFPTEGTNGRHETEDGSISCTALSLLYAYLFVENKKEYFETAKQMLLLHDNWCMKIPDARQNGSTLRWWEANWEGDADGSSINAGHAWTIWKAEADYLYAYITGDFDRIVRSFNGYITNFCKAREDGGMYTCFTPDFVTSHPYKIKHSYPDLTDGSMPYYVWARSAETWFITSVVYGDENGLHALNGRLNNGKLYTGAIELKRLFVNSIKGTVEINTETALEIIGSCTAVYGKIIKQSEGKITVTPSNGKIIIGGKI